MHRPSLAALAFAATSLAATTPEAAAQIQDIGAPSNGWFTSSAISADGTIIAGTAYHATLGAKASVWSHRRRMGRGDWATHRLTAAPGRHELGCLENQR